MKLNILALCFLTVVISGCGFFNQKKNEPELLIVNVLDKNLYDDCHIKGSVNVPFEEFDNWIKDKLNSKKIDINDHVVVYCSNYMCTASGYCAKSLLKQNFKNVWAYEAGMAEWFQKGYPIEGVCQKPYLTKSTNKPEHVENEVKLISTEELADKIDKMHLKS